MKIENKKSFIHQKKVPLLAALLLLGVVAAAGVYSLTGGNLLGTPQTSENENDSTQVEDSSGEENSKDNNLPEGTIDTGAGKPDENNEATDPGQQPDDENSEILRASITAASQNGGTVQVRVLIQGVTSGGTCSLTLEKNGVIVSRSAGIQALAHSSTCQGFDIPTSELSSGEWTLKVTISANNNEVRLTETISVT